MKLLVLALAAQAAIGGGSLGVALDVLPAAYSFAASRYDAEPDLRLASCDKTSCRWSAGHGVDLVAYVSGYNLDIGRMEVISSGGDAAWFGKACLVMVSLTLAGSDPADVRAIAAAISRPPDAPGARLQRDVEDVRFYATSGPHGVPRLCGATLKAA